MGLKYTTDTNFTWGLQCLDEKFGKPSTRELVVMFGYSGIGKTEYSFFVARRNSEEGNIVNYISLELSAYDMKQRICLSRAGVSKYEFQTEKYTEIQKEIMDSTYIKLESLKNLNIISPQDKGIDSILRLIIEGYNNGCKMFFIDNLDKVTYHGENENARYNYITSQLQDLKNKLDICIVLIHHARKPFNKQQTMIRAGLEGLRGSQKIIDNSTQCFEIFRDLDPDDIEAHKITEIIQLKDTFGGPKGFQRLEYKSGNFIEYINDKEKQIKKKDPF